MNNELSLKQVSPLNGLDRAQRRRLTSYCKRMSSDQKCDWFDDRFRDLLKRFEKQSGYVDQCISYLDRIHFTQSHKQAKLMDETIVDGFCGKSHPYFGWNRNFKKACDQVKSEMRRLDCVQLGYSNDNDIAEQFSKLDTNAGWTYFESGKRSKGDNVEGLFLRYSKALEEAYITGTLGRPKVPNYRTQSSDIYGKEGTLKAQGEVSKCKTRVILMTDIIEVAHQMKWFNPLQDAFHDLDWYAGGKSDDDIRIEINEMVNRWNYWFSFDYSKFDITISDWLLSAAYDCLKAAFERDPGFNEKEWDIMVHDGICKMIVRSDGTLVLSTKGNGSGDRQTSIIASVVNRICTLTWMNAFQVDGWFEVLGDDNLFFTNDDLDPTEVATYLKENLGIVMNPDKCASGECRKQYPEFLSREWRAQGAWRDPLTLIAKGCYPERWRDYRIADPALVVYSYILTFPLGMREFFRVDAFLREFPNLSHEWKKERAVQLLPGNLRYRVEHEGVDTFYLDLIPA